MIVLIAGSVYGFTRFFPRGNEPVGGGDLPLGLGGIGCSLTVEQPDCQKQGNVELKFKWENCGDQVSYRIEVDDTAYIDNNFLHPEISSGDILSDAKEYTINSEKIQPDRNYYVGLTIKDKNGIRSGWWGWGEKFLKIKPLCD